MTTIQETNQRKYDLSTPYLEAGWKLEWDDEGWCCAEHPKHGHTSLSFPNRIHGLKFLERKIDKLAQVGDCIKSNL